MNSEKIQQFKDEFKQEIEETLKNSQLCDLLRKYNLSADKVLKFQCTLDLTKVQLSDANEGQQAKETAPVITDQELIKVLNDDWCLSCCCFCN